MFLYRSLRYAFRVFFDLQVFRDAYTRERGAGVLYLLILLTLGWFIVAWKHEFFKLPPYQADVTDPSINLAALLYRNASQFPGLTFTRGNLSANVAQPYEIVDAESSVKVAVIDTTGKVTDLAQSGSLLLFTMNQLMAKAPGDRQVIYDYDKEFTAELTPQEIERLIKSVVESYGWFSILSLIFSSFLLFAVSGLFFAGSLYLLLQNYRPKLSFRGLSRVAMLTLTPTIVIKLLLNFFEIQPFKYPGLIFFMVTLLYSIFALEALFLKKQK